MSTEQKNAAIARAEKVYKSWDRALSDLEQGTPEQTNAAIERLLALYTQDAILESPLIPHLTGNDSGMLRGHEEIRKLLRIVAQRKPRARKYYRTGFFTDGKTLMWEYPRSTRDGEQMDFVEVMELSDEGLICRHRVYWGWFGVRLMQQDQYRRE